MKYGLFKRKGLSVARHFNPGQIIELEGDVQNINPHTYTFHIARKHKTDKDTGSIAPYETEIFTSYIGKDIHYYEDNYLGRTHMYLDSDYLHVFNTQAEIASHVLRTVQS